MNNKLKEYCNNISISKLSVTKDIELLNFKDELIQHTSFLMYDTVPLALRYYCIQNDITNIPKCKCCENPVTYKKDSPKDGFGIYCSPKCSRSDKTVNKNIEVLLKNKEWLIDQRVNLRKSKELIAKELGCSTTVITRWLTTHNIEDIRTDIKNTKIVAPDKDILIKLYFDENKTLLDISKIFNVSNVTVKTWFTTYDIELLSHKETIKLKVIPKIIESNQLKYGVDHIFSLDSIKEKIKNTFINNYGVHYHPISNTSNSEQSVLEYFNTLTPGFKKDTSLGVELDGYNDTLNIAFEYNGNYWHKESIKGSNLHQKKYELCKSNNIRLFTIFEDEWLDRNHQVKSFIKSALGLYDVKLFARKCEFALLEPNNKIVYDFYEDNHIQGFPSNNVAHYCLLYDSEIVASITLGLHHRNMSELIISRYCVKANYTIIGGSKRLFSRLISDIGTNVKLKTWSDNRWTDGKMYDRLGFKPYNISKNYYYVKNGKRYNKQNFTKSKLGIQDKNITEYEYMKSLGYDRIWDCGKILWIYET